MIHPSTYGPPSVLECVDVGIETESKIRRAVDAGSCVGMAKNDGKLENRKKETRSLRLGLSVSGVRRTEKTGRTSCREHVVSQ